MTNPLQLDAVLCQDEALTECSPVSPTTLQRSGQAIRGLATERRLRDWDT
jgi:hypothetical protein